ncbi:MAG: hypothetical protein P4L16_04645 [Chlamydiales bacterium]|nr:hypothetical protein [Chlamydiales bacterium]
MQIKLSRFPASGLYESIAIDSMKADDIKIVLDAIKNVDKTKQWVCYDLLPQDSSLFGRILYVILRWIPGVKSFFYSIDLDASKNRLNELKAKVNQLQDRKLEQLFNEAVGNFNAIAPRHQADSIFESEMTPDSDKANRYLSQVFTLVAVRSNMISENGFRISVIDLKYVSDEGICALDFTNRTCKVFYLKDLKVITDRSLKHFESVQGLERLEITRCPKISTDGVISLLRSVDKSKFSQFSLEDSCPLTPELIAQLAEMPALTKICLGDLQPSKLKDDDLAPLRNKIGVTLQITKPALG